MKLCSNYSTRKPEVQAEPGEEVEPGYDRSEEDIAAIEDVEDLRS